MPSNGRPLEGEEDICFSKTLGQNTHPAGEILDEDIL
jgi:hypothetical protein